MTYQAFLETLEALAMQWDLGPGGEIRTKLPPHRSTLTAVCATRTGRGYRPDQWPEAAIAIGLSLENAKAIHVASEAILPYARDERLALLEACNLRRRPRQGAARQGPLAAGTS